MYFLGSLDSVEGDQLFGVVSRLTIMYQADNLSTPVAQCSKVVVLPSCDKQSSLAHLLVFSCLQMDYIWRPKRACFGLSSSCTRCVGLCFMMVLKSMV